MQIVKTDFVVIGAGVAGLSCALEAGSAGKVALLVKDELPSGNTTLAQGGIAVALGREDRPEYHIEDTLIAGAGVCDRTAVETLVVEGQARVMELLNMGYPCDKDNEGKPLFSREGAHSMPRVISAWGDESGRALAETLLKHVREKDTVAIYENTAVVKLVMQNSRCQGAVALDLNSGKEIFYAARAVVLAAGGCGQIYAHTTNNLHCTGDGFALALRAGAVLENMEFVQFHPTALNTNENPMFLISEAVRGEGAVLVNNKGKRFMADRHPLAELAPRDIVARGIYSELNAGHSVFLDVTALGDEFAKRFPTIYKACRDRGLCPPKELIPVTPAAHFIMGGVKTDLNGRTNVPGLYACGEVASTGVHGANRLASNSLLEGLVFGFRAGRAMGGEAKGGGLENLTPIFAKVTGTSRPETGTFTSLTKRGNETLTELRQIMWDKVGLIRSAKSLTDAIARLDAMEKALDSREAGLKNMITVAALIAKGALARRESRGGHYRIDFPSETCGSFQDVSSL